MQETTINIVQQIQNADIEVFGNKGVINPDKRVLIIGLGGTGTDTLLLTKHTISNRFKLEGNKIPDNIQLLAIDTDRSILGKSRGKTRIEQHEFLILSDPNITANLHNKENLPPYFRSWVNPSLQVPPGVVPGTDGAGAIRQIGRYLLISNYQKLYEKIRKKISAAMVAAQGGGLVDIIILSGISGGTGSGTFIDMGYIVRKVCQDLVIADLQKQITAYLYLPDVNIGNPNVPEASHNFIRCNGYAALKDLDYFMGIPDKRAVSAGGNAKKAYRFKQKYTHNDSVNMEEAPFDSTYLISGVPDAISPMQDAYEYSINITADSIVNFIAGNLAQGHSSNLQPGVASVDINGAAMIASNPNITLPNGRDMLANYDYKIIGASLATLPMQSITNYIAGVLMTKIDALKNQQPQKADYEKFYHTVGVQNLETRVYSRLGEPSVGVAGKNLKDDINSYMSILQRSIKNYRQNAAANIQDFVHVEIDTLKNAIMTELDRCFTDIDKGPFYANTLLANANYGIISYLQSVATNYTQRSQAYSASASKCAADAQQAYTDANNAIFGKADKYQRYIDLLIEQCRNEVRATVCNKLSANIHNSALGQQNTLVDVMRKKNRTIFNVYSKILTTLSEKFSGNGITTVHNNAGKVFIWEVVGIEKVEPEIKNSINPDQLNNQIVQLLTDMIQQSDKWCNGDSPLSEFGDFISEAFAEVLSKSMDDYLAVIPTDELNRSIEHLDKGARYHFPSIAGIDVNVSNIYNRITVPTTAPIMKHHIESYLENQGITTKPDESLLTERISWTRVGVGVPIFQYAYLQQYEAAYENIEPAKKQGMHLYENEGLHGTSYPALLPPTYYAHEYENRREARRYAKICGIFDQAEKLGIIAYAPHAAYAKIIEDGWIESQINGILAKYNIDSNDIEASDISELELQECINELREITERNVRYENIYIPESAGYDSNPEDARYYAKASFSRMPEAGMIVEKEIERLANINSVIERLNRMIESFKVDKDIYLSFVYAFKYEIIKSAGAICQYGKGEEKLDIVNRLTNKLWRYTAFKAFDETVYPLEKDNIEGLRNDAASSMEELKDMLCYCEDTLKAMTINELPKLSYLNDDEEGSNTKRFYNKLRMFLNAEIDSLRSITQV